jgi:periplasmic divalent cation tolerance protein
MLVGIVLSIFLELQNTEYLDASERNQPTSQKRDVGHPTTRSWIILLMTDACIVLTTLDDLESAKQMARRLVEMRLAACVNIVERIHSVYRWQGEIESADEILLMIKTAVPRIPALKEEIVQLHPYQLPEIVVLKLADGSEPYLSWLLAASQDETR